MAESITWKARFYSWLKPKVEAFFDWNTRLLVELMLYRAGVFRKQGLWKEAARELVQVSGLSDSDFDDPAGSLEKLRAKFAAVDPERFMGFLLQMGTFLVDDRQLPWVAKVLELDSGIQPADFESQTILAERLRERTKGFSANLGFFYCVRLAHLFGLTERSNEELAVMEAILGIEPRDYYSVKALRSKFRDRTDLDPTILDMAVMLYFACLGKLGRKKELLSLLEAVLEVGPDDCHSPDQIRAKLRGSLGGFDDFSAMNFAMLLNRHFAESGRDDLAVSALEAYLLIEPADYSDPKILDRKLKQTYRGSSPEIMAFMDSLLIVGLLKTGQTRSAIAVLQAEIEIRDLASVSQDVLTEKVTERCESLPPNLSPYFRFAISLALTEAGWKQEASQIFASEFDSWEVDWESASDLANALEMALADLAASTKLAFVAGLFSALLAEGKEEKAGLLGDAYLRKMLAKEEDAVAAALLPGASTIYAEWLSRWSNCEEKEPITLCRQLMPRLRLALADQGMVLADREAFLRSVADLRRLIVAAGFYWAEKAETPELKDELFQDAFRWDLELAQRLLAERFLLGQILPVEPGSLPVPMNRRSADDEGFPESKFFPDPELIFSDTLCLRKMESPR